MSIKEIDMKAALMTRFGGPDVFQYGETARPVLKKGEVLVRIHAAGMNYYDTLVRRGAVSMDIPLPHIMGSDIVGTIEETGEDVSGFAAGDPVIVAPGFPVNESDWNAPEENYAPSYYPGGTFNHGGYAQFMAIHHRWLIRNETGLSDAEAATLPLVLVTAMHAVKKQGNVGEGTKVLVQAGASGSGSMAIQVAKALGAKVITTVSTRKKAEIAIRSGADEVVFYKDQDFPGIAREWSGGDGVDVVIDNLGGSALPGNIEALRWGGTIVNFGLMAGIEATIPNMYLYFRGQYRLVGSFMGTMDELRDGLGLVGSGKIRPVLDEILPLSRVQEAHEKIDGHRVAGNLVLDPWG